MKQAFSKKEVLNFISLFDESTEEEQLDQPLISWNSDGSYNISEATEKVKSGISIHSLIFGSYNEHENCWDYAFIEKNNDHYTLTDESGNSIQNIISTPESAIRKAIQLIK